MKSVKLYHRAVIKTIYTTYTHGWPMGRHSACRINLENLSNRQTLRIQYDHLHFL